jgi:NhaA family Na+:H+ antiporter
VFSEFLTFIFFILIGLEIREGLEKAKDAIFPALCALSGMVLPALIFKLLNSGSNAWAVAMPTDVALAIAVLSLAGKRVNPHVRLFLLTLAVSDDLFSLMAIGFFFRKDLHLASAMYTLGAALIGFFLPYRKRLISFLSPVATFFVIPLYIWINLLSKLDFSQSLGKISLSIVISRVVGKALGITLAAFLIDRFGKLKFREVAGVGFLAGVGMSVSIVIAGITLTSAAEISQVRMGLFFAAIISGVLGLLTLRNSA